MDEFEQPCQITGWTPQAKDGSHRLRMAEKQQKAHKPLTHEASLQP